jgi:hypothetical protein
MTTTTMHDDWNEALFATARRMDVKVVEEGQKQARVILRREAAARRAIHEEAMKAISETLKRDIAASDARIAAEFASLRQAQADGRGLAIAIGAHDKEARSNGGAR